MLSIYKISMDGSDKVYIGSTKNFSRRKWLHKQKAKYDINPNLKLYVTIRELGGWDECKCKMEIIEDKVTIERERYWIEYYGEHTFNINKPLGKKYKNDDCLQNMQDSFKISYEILHEILDEIPFEIIDTTNISNSIIKETFKKNNIRINYMDKIKKTIEEKRPTLSKSSITTYGSILKNLYKKVFNDEEFDLDKFNNPDATLEFLKDSPPNKRKTILSALVIITDQKPYRDLMLEDVRSYNKEIDLQTKSETQKENWVNGNDIGEIYSELKRDAEAIYKKKNPTSSDLQQIQNYIIMSLLGGVYIPPRRSKDFVDFKIKNIEKEKDNYMDKNKLVFNSYKTAKTYGQQVVDIPKELKSILTKWIKLNPTEHLLFDVNMNKLSSVKLNQRLNKIFDNRKISVNNLRHSYLTDKYAKTSEENKKLEKDMEEMGSNAKNMATTYIKLK